MSTGTFIFVYLVSHFNSGFELLRFHRCHVTLQASECQEKADSQRMQHHRQKKKCTGTHYDRRFDACRPSGRRGAKTTGPDAFQGEIT